jgi:hypothetical protein
MSKPHCILCSSALLIIWFMASSISCAQTIPDPDLKGLYRMASQNVFEATGDIFSCLSDARKGNPTRTVYYLGDAGKSLNDARNSYNQIATDRRKTAFRPRTEDSDVRKIISDYNTEQEGSGKKALDFEGDIAQKNVDAIADLLKQISTWKNCSPSIKELLDLFQNKIKLERASQIAEIAWGD